MRVTDTHIYFWGSYLSNFYWAPFTVQDITYHSSEQYFMMCKAIQFDDFDAAEKILNAHDAKAAKALGRKVKNFDVNVWDEHSLPAMLDAVLYKFEEPNNIVIRERLLETGNKILVEASPLDKIWGVGLHEDDDLILNESNWLGENRLGEVLMRVRVILQETSSYEDNL